MIEALATAVQDLSEIKTPDIDELLHKSRQEMSYVDEMSRKKVRDALATLENLWKCMSVGANTVPKACLNTLQKVRNFPVYCAFTLMISILY
jgi:predicted house-cleaning NTP pyrophosphatase (Maf/HAM1 superfamily)